MNLFNTFGVHGTHASNRPDRVSKGQRQPASPPLDDEMGLLGLKPDRTEDQVAWFGLTSKPEEYFTCNPDHGSHEVL